MIKRVVTQRTCWPQGHPESSSESEVDSIRLLPAWSEREVKVSAPTEGLVWDTSGGFTPGEITKMSAGTVIQRG